MTSKTDIRKTPVKQPRKAAGNSVFRLPGSTGKELDLETGFSYFGARYLDNALSTAWLSVDPMSDKYPSISPYAYCAWNPVKLTDPNGDSIIVCPQNKEKGNDVLLSSLLKKTGLYFYVNEKGLLLYKKDENGTPIVEGGSETARNDMIRAIDDKAFDLILYYKNGDKDISGGASDIRSSLHEQSRIFIDIADFDGDEPETFDIGMVFLHEFQHGYFGLSDNVGDESIYSSADPYYYKRGHRGDVVDKVNVYRRELNLPTREAYKQSPYTNKIPFSLHGKTIWIDGYIN